VKSADIEKLSLAVGVAPWWMLM